MPNHDPVTGKFLSGNKASPGRPSRRVETAFQDAMLETVRKEAPAISKKMAELAKQGDVSAARFLAEYTTPKPPQTLELVRAEELAVIKSIRDALDARGIPLVDFLTQAIQLLTESADLDDAAV